ncbi:MAG: hypothetical protein ABIF10_01535 [Candidatus Woesearchaeota archaeon]
MSKLFWVVVIFLVVGAYIIKVAYDYDFGKADDRTGFASKFLRWVVQLGKNIAGMVSYAADKEWLPETNKTNQTGT